MQGDRFVLNGRPYLLRMVLDQGYWPETGCTAPDDAALRRDVELAKRDGVQRRAQASEDRGPTVSVLGRSARALPSGKRCRARTASPRHRSNGSRANGLEVIARDYSHPCIIAWVPINESWGVPNLPDSPRERHYVQALYHLTQTLDPTRPVIGNDGWESVATDIIGIHDYDDDPERIARRYRADEVLPRLFKRERPGGRLLVLEERQHADQPFMLTEFGGIALRSARGRTWGYTHVCDARGVRRQVSTTCSRSFEIWASFAGSAIRSSPTRTRKRTDSCTPIGRRSSPSSRLPRPQQGPRPDRSTRSTDRLHQVRSER